MYENIDRHVNLKKNPEKKIKKQLNGRGIK